MQESLEEKISMLLDDELSKDEAISLLDRIGKDEELKKLWYRYSKISLALKSDAFFPADNEFPDRVKQRIESAPVIPIRKSSVAGNRMWVIAVAASLLLAVIFTWPRLFSGTSTPVKPVVVVEKSPEIGSKTMLVHNTDVLDSRLNDYLVTHNESAYSTGTQGMLPYARVVSYGDR